jgi:hypothetical protein
MTYVYELKDEFKEKRDYDQIGEYGSGFQVSFPPAGDERFKIRN